ncbi:alanine racemase [Anaeromyxobacter sp. Fw109-5]|uniref:alanine racemase n=1 Tax=Anaeromyxobacter sp. (strain Fw109-5) TaxID=404589 RepID=UPI0000ED71EA|nr:alanine racemase [Anaeromyxobacter sp. Fw109-5]ABS27670.1 alanine racemase [Anaeromyxobacter sp. Fw109-5]
MVTDPSQWGGRPVWAEIDLDALAHNVRLLAARAAPSKLYAVVKANAYGHGAIAVGRAALAAGASALAVVCVDEAEELRRGGVDAPILVIGYTPPADAARVVALDLRPTVASADVAEALAVAAKRRGVPVAVHLELETGLNRHGLTPDALVALATRLRAMPELRVEGLFTHFAAAEEGDQRFTRRQFDVLRDVSARLSWIPERHCAASASLLLDHEMALEVVRAGLSMYGYRPAPWCGTDADLRPVLSLRARVARVLEVERGATVGYGRTWAAARPSRVALVMCGYADGYRRSLGNRAHLLVRGRRAPVVGRVAMDMCMVDVTAVPEVRAGDVATLLGRDGEERVDADELASLADTISWEILAGITARVPRLYLRGGVVESVSTLAERVPLAPG